MLKNILSSKIIELETSYSLFSCDGQDYCKTLEQNHLLACETLIILSPGDNVANALATTCAVCALAESPDEFDLFSGVSQIITSKESIDEKYLELVYHRHFKLPMTIVSTDRYVLRELLAGDFEAFYEALTGTTQDSVPNIPIDSKKTCSEWFSSYIASQYAFYGFGYYGIFVDGLDSMVGFCGFNKSSEDDLDVLELGYAVSARFRGQGHASFAVGKLMQFAFEDLDVCEVTVRIRKANTASIKTIERVLLNENLLSAKKSDIGNGFLLYRINSNTMGV